MPQLILPCEKNKCPNQQISGTHLRLGCPRTRDPDHEDASSWCVFGMVISLATLGLTLVFTFGSLLNNYLFVLLLSASSIYSASAS